MRRVGLFGGSFNPIHKMHLEIALKAKELLDLDSITFIPAHISPLKDPSLLASNSHRLNMLKIAIEDHKDFNISNVELDRGGKSYTIDTLNIFTKNDPETKYFLIMGLDSLETFKKWHRYDEIIQLVDIIVYPRENCNFQDIISSFEGFNKISPLNNFIDLYQITPSHILYYMKLDNLEGSSTKIRKILTKKAEAAELLPVKVLNYIEKNELYGLK